MVLTPRLRTFNIADPSPMEVEMGSDSGTNPSSRKRQRSVTYDAPDALPDDLPELPKLSGQIMLEVFTHRSLRLACHAKYRDNERLSVLGSYILEMMTTQLLFNKKPMLTRSEIEVERQRLLSVDIIDAWADFYRLRDELRYDPSFQSSLGEVEEGRLLFLAYLGAVFSERGLTTVQQWIGALLQLSDSVFKEGATFDLGPADFEEQSGKRPKVKEPLQGFSTQPLQHALLSLSTGYKPTHYNPYSQTTSSLPPPPPNIPPPIQPPPPKGMPNFGNPLAPAQPHLAFLPLFNQTAIQRGLNTAYPASFSGPPHAGKWTVTCIGEQNTGFVSPPR
jgi:dsRNA-specific ribonuclease